MDSATLTSVNVRITNLLDGTAEVLAANTAGTNIVANYNSGTGLMTLIGVDTVANYQQVLRTVTYDNSQSNPDMTDRIITYQLTDGMNPAATATTTLSIIAANERPTAEQKLINF